MQVDSSVLELISEISRKVDAAHSDILRSNAAAAAEQQDDSANALKAKVQASVADLQKGLLERETEVPCPITDSVRHAVSLVIPVVRDRLKRLPESSYHR